MLAVLKKETNARNGQMQIFDLLQLSRKEREMKAASQRILRKFEEWKRNHAQEDASLKMYGQVEGILLRRQAQDAVMLYRLVRRDRLRAFADYVERLPTQKSLFRAAKQ